MEGLQSRNSAEDCRIPLVTFKSHKAWGSLGLLTFDREPVSLPQGQSMRRELLELRTKLSKQESLLQSTVERLKTANQQKESMEQFIFGQCGCPPARGWERKLGKGETSRLPTCAADGW